jgi:hypothetical protein
MRGEEMEKKVKHKPDPIKSKRCSSNVNKGKSNERWFTNLLKEIDPTAKRNITESRDPDVDIETKLPFAFQVRSGQCCSPAQALKDALYGADIRKKRWALGVVKDDFKTPFIIMLMSDWTDLCLELYGGVNKPEVPKHIFVTDEKAPKPIRKENLKQMFHLHLEEFKRRQPEKILLVVANVEEVNCVVISVDHFFKWLKEGDVDSILGRRRK